MKLNCKVGDVAYVIGGRNPANYGCVVEVIEFCGHMWDGPTWFVRGLIDGNPRCRDAVLRPLRDSDEPDEMLRIAGLPKRDEVTV